MSAAPCGPSRQIGPVPFSTLDFDLSTAAVDQIFNYGFDANDRLLWEQSDLDADGVIDDLASYSYGENNSATQQTAKTVVAGSALNSPLSTLSYSYDLQGRMATTVVERFATDGVTVAERESTSFDYDHTGIRVTAHNKLERISSDTGLLETRHELDTTYLVDHQNFTGYEQVLREVTTDATGYVVRKVIYTLGHDVVSQWSAGFIASYAPEYDPENGGMSFSNVPTGSHLFLYDGHGSVRSILPRGRYWDIGIDKSFTYDAYGNALGFNPTFAGTVILYRGEQYDIRIGLGYNRGRYVDFRTGTWKTKDPFAGNMQDPQSLHKYAYVHGDPVNGIDPTGKSLAGTLGSLAMVGAIRGMKLGAIGAATGAIIGGVDEALAGENIVKGAIGGAKWGAAIGFSLGFLAPFATTFLAPTTLSLIANMGAGASLIFGTVGSVDSFSNDHVAQGFFRLGLGFFGAYSLRSGATRPTKPVNIGGEGEVPGAVNLQGRWALSRTYGRAQATPKGEPAGQNLAGMIAEGHEFVIYNARTGKLPFANNSVPKVHTSSIPIDSPGGGAFGGAPGVSSAEITRVLRPGGQWIKDGVVFFTKPG